MKYYEGYDVKQEVWLIKRAYISKEVEPSVVKGKIIYKGTKKIKVSVEGFDFTLKENDIVGRTVLGVTYTLYKTKEEANSILEKEKRTLDLKQLISNGLSEMSLEQLENIYAYMLSS